MSSYRTNLSKSVCLALLGKHDRASVPSLRETHVERFEAEGLTLISLVYQHTAVVKFGPDGITLNSANWRTTTTKARINAALHGTGYTVTQTDFSWKVYKNGEFCADFQDGMTLPG